MEEWGWDNQTIATDILYGASNQTRRLSNEGLCDTKLLCILIKVSTAETEMQKTLLNCKNNNWIAQKKNRCSTDLLDLV